MKTEKPPKTSGSVKIGDFCFGTGVPHIERLSAQGTLASSDPVAGADANRLAPDAVNIIYEVVSGRKFGITRSSESKMLNFGWNWL